MNMVHLTKGQIIMVNLIKGKIKMVNLIKPYPFNMANLTKPWPFWWIFVHFDQIFGLIVGQKSHFNQMYWSNATCVFHAQIFSQNGHTLGSIKTLQSKWPFEKSCFLVVHVPMSFNTHGSSSLASSSLAFPASLAFFTTLSLVSSPTSGTIALFSLLYTNLGFSYTSSFGLSKT